MKKRRNPNITNDGHWHITHTQTTEVTKKIKKKRKTTQNHFKQKITLKQFKQPENKTQ